MFFINPATWKPIAVLPFKSALKNIARSLTQVDSVWLCADSSAVKRWAAQQIEANTHADCPIEYFVKSYVACFYYCLDAGEVKLAYRYIALAFSAAAVDLPPSTASRMQLLTVLKHCDDQHTEFRSDITENFERYSARLQHNGRTLNLSLLEELIDAQPKEDLHPEIKEWFQAQKRRTYECLPHLEEVAHSYQSIRSTHGQSFDAFKQVEEVFLTKGEVCVDYLHQGELKKIVFEILDATDDSSQSLVFARMGALKKTLLNKEAPIFVDCNDYQHDRFDPGTGAYAWILAGGIWVCPSHGSIYGRSSDADNIVSCLNELKARGFDCSTVILSGRGINARVAARVALSDPSIVTDLILENGVFEHAAHDPLIENFHTISTESPINPTVLTQLVLFLTDSLNLQHFVGIMNEGSKDNLYVGQSNSIQQSLDNVTALAFAMHTAGLVHAQDQASAP